MTYIDLFNTQKPFIVQTRGNLTDSHIYYPDTEGVFVMEEQSGKIVEYRLKHEIPTIPINFNKVVIDWFEDDKYTHYQTLTIKGNIVKRPCSCDLHSVLLRYGCQCNGY